MARRPSIVIRAKVDGKHRFFAPAWNKNGALKPGYAKRHQGPFGEYSYYIRWTENGRRRMECVGSDAATAVMIAKQRQSIAATKQADAEANPGERCTVRGALGNWLDWAKAHKSKGTHDAYKCSAELFLEFCATDGIVYLDQITEGRLLDYKLSLERKGYAEPTRWKLLNQIHGGLRRAKFHVWLDRDDMPHKDSGARYAEWTLEHTKAMLESGCTEPGDWEFVALIAMAGVRRNEIVHCERGDFDFRTNEVTVRDKPRYNHKVKDRQERTIGIDAALASRIKKYIDGLPEKQSLLFPAARGGVERHLEKRTKRIAKAAGVPIPKKPNHAFRVSYATRLNRNGTDIETVRRLLGHYDIKTTQIYLRSLENQDPRLQAQVKAATAELGIKE
ncbi:MAG: tyrosine-type recombinase/integrase [Candidatus Acidiferrales bacterium]